MIEYTLHFKFIIQGKEYDIESVRHSDATLQEGDVVYIDLAFFHIHAQSVAWTLSDMNKANVIMETVVMPHGRAEAVFAYFDLPVPADLVVHEDSE